ncbi:MAG: hypothetical protein HC879_21440 [Leptolyngbyaceae cyanobacterium SL_5_9]|nr:hypothetical protein [bacterium]NJN59862.1 hypothetical protein [Leptolyngbyaceae cyanobacterium SL_5_9]
MTSRLRSFNSCRTSLSDARTSSSVACSFCNFAVIC